MIIVVPLLVLLVFGLSSSTGGSSGASSSGRRSNSNQTVVHQPPPQQQQPQVIVVQSPSGTPKPQAAVQPAPAQAKQASPIRNFAVKSYSQISKDSQKGSGEYLNSLILLMESEGIPKDEAQPLIKRALRKSNGNAEVFGDELEKSL